MVPEKRLFVQVSTIWGQILFLVRATLEAVVSMSTLDRTACSFEIRASEKE